MLNIFKTGGYVKDERPQQKKEVKFETEPNVITVEQIHNEFRTASDKILIDVDNFNLKTKAQKASRLERFGLTSTKDNVESVEFLRKQAIAEVVNKYRFTHPNNKVISSSSVHQICKKYNLVHCSTQRYTGFVPEKNLKEIEDFKFPDGIMVYLDSYSPDSEKPFGPFNTEQEAQDFAEQKNKEIAGRGGWARYKVDSPIKRLTICAPLDKVELRHGEKIQDNKIVYPDPIILHQIENNCYLIVTAWGDEASDPEVVNEKMN